MGKTKIIATLGPSTLDGRIVVKMVDKGASGFRLNFSHGTYDEKLRHVKNVRRAEEERGKYLPVISDITGPCVRTGKLSSEFKVEVGEELRVSKEAGYGGRILPVDNDLFYEAVEVGDTILLDDGKVVLSVEGKLGDSLKCKVVRSGTIRSRMSLALKGKEVVPTSLTEKDVRDLEFSANLDVEYYAMSFIRTADDLKALKRELRRLGVGRARVIAKIETRRAVENLEEIVEESDLVMVARGDLGLYFPLEEIPALQKKIIEKSVSKGKPVIVATQLLESVTYNPTPTRSEVVDVATAVNEGVDALLLTGETAIGKYPVEAVEWLSKIINAAEKIHAKRMMEGEETIYDKFVKGVVLLAESMGAKIVAYSRVGNTPRRLSRYRPRVPVYLVTGDLKVARQSNILWGIASYYVPEAVAPENAWNIMRGVLVERGELKRGDIVIYTVGLREGITDVVRIERLS